MPVGISWSQLDCATLAAAGLVALCLNRYVASRRPYASLPLPPGPKSSWLGKVSLPQTYQWLTYAEWRQTYGDLIYIYIFGNPILVLNSAKAASDLLEKRGSNYSSRPIRTMVVELIGWDWLFSAMHYGNRWKRHRNLFHAHFRPSDTAVYHSLQTRETHTLLRNLLAHPDDFRYNIRRLAAAVILNVTYGHQVAEGGDEYVALADRALSSLAKAGIYGTYIVDYIPMLKHLPAWLPFASFKRQAYEWRKSVRDMVNRPFEMIKDQMQEGTAAPCFVAQELEKRATGSDFEDEDIIKNVAATAYAAGSDTFVSAVLSFFLVALLYPDVQKKAQEELDRVIGGRLPHFDDRTQLPFIESLCYELLRWNPVTPMGLAHYAAEDDEYCGYRIPKGTTVLPNVWAILHDPEVYPDPLIFNPSRFVDREGNSAAGINVLPDVAFGFGRRMCPGRWFAFDIMWIVVASVLSVYDISKATDENGEVVEPVVEYTSHLLSHPKPFKCRIAPRSPSARLLVEQTVLES
ncbi:hypothetical protein Hypma_015428 [Hypsizygus marmoreus]|uniref:O-methylsterigmatocystin oxidoreductase n=1 Tax=Hypsizygus marmoreus TaxID=39966 RepID=A0A369KCQ9_HYPMA|nr:hypothetical protein Hypma_015428 [Hypsizygus marmoreus]